MNNEPLESYEAFGPPKDASVRLFLEQARLMASLNEVELYTEYRQEVPEGFMRVVSTRSMASPEDCRQDILLCTPDDGSGNYDTLMSLTLFSYGQADTLQPVVTYDAEYEKATLMQAIESLGHSLRQDESLSLEECEILNYLDQLNGCEDEVIVNELGRMSPQLWKTVNDAVADRANCYMSSRIYEHQKDDFIVKVETIQYADVTDKGSLNVREDITTNVVIQNNKSSTFYTFEHHSGGNVVIDTCDADSSEEDIRSQGYPRLATKVDLDFANSVLAEFLIDIVPVFDLRSLSSYGRALVEEINGADASTELPIEILTAQTAYVQTQFKNLFEKIYHLTPEPAEDLDRELVKQVTQETTKGKVDESIFKNDLISFNVISMASPYLIDIASGGIVTRLQQGSVSRIRYLTTRLLNVPQVEESAEDIDGESNHMSDYVSGFYVKGLYTELNIRRQAVVKVGWLLFDADEYISAFGNHN